MSSSQTGFPSRALAAQVTPAERTAGTETDLREYSPADIESMAVTHGGGTLVPLTMKDTTGTTYTAILTDKDRTLIQRNNAAANTITIPPNSSVAFAVGIELNVVNWGAGQTTIVAGAGVTLRTSSTLVLRAQYSVATVVKVATDEWLLTGDVNLI